MPSVAVAAASETKSGPSLSSTLWTVFFYSVFESIKQASNYGVRYLNAGQYPVPQTLFVAISEIIKVTVVTVRLRGELKKRTF
jgi:hypothetical protein